MVMFHSYVSLLEGIQSENKEFFPMDLGVHMGNVVKTIINHPPNHNQSQMDGLSLLF